MNTPPQTTNEPEGFGSRIEARAWLESLGFRTKDNVTKKVDILFIGPGHGQRKMEKALKYGIPIIPTTLALAVGFFTRRSGSPMSTAPGLSALTLHTLALLDNLHAHYHLTGDERYGIGCRLLDGVVSRLLLLSRGAPGSEPPSGSEVPSWFNRQDLAQIINDIDRAWELVIAILETIDD